MAVTADDPLYLVVSIYPKPERRAEAEATLLRMRDAARQEPGNVFMHLLESPDDPNTWIMVEKFASRAAWDEHMTTETNREGNRALEDLLRQPSELRLLREK
jgi:quinol monooxygenase YgiN